MKSPTRPVVLVISDYYLPGYKSGGGMRSVVNMVDRFSDRYDFRVLTRDHDGPLDVAPYTSVNINAWNKVGNASVFYISKDRLSMRGVRRIVSKAGPDLIYSNSFFTPANVRLMHLRKFGAVPKSTLIISPCGELSPAALEIKKAKKAAFIRASNVLGFHQNVIWKASSDSEAAEISRALGDQAHILIAPDLPPASFYSARPLPKKPAKSAGAATFAFLSRFARIKNFGFLIDLLRDGIKGNIEINVLGPIEDTIYWDECQRAAKDLSSNIRINVHGAVMHELVVETLAQSDFLISPTRSENFGHALLEALAAGCPLVVSDRTPWRQLQEKGIGWDMPLEDPAVWKAQIQKCMDMDAAEYKELSGNARVFAKEYLSDPRAEEPTRQLFAIALEDKRHS
ncbi:MAG: glycosyltransferase family 4 protein [Acidobacteria bacterium]|nr:glycosyltransferase family 4 protein [Acidobacteriota bacterium]